MKIFAARFVVALALGWIGCSARTSSTGPSPVPITIQLSGAVYDSAFRPLAGAAVEVLDGAKAGTSVTADAEGRYALTGTFDATTRFRATREGYVDRVQTFECSCIYQDNNRHIYFFLAVPEPPVDISGEYTLTFVADSGCTSIPAELRTRTYQAMIASDPSAELLPVNTHFLGRTRGAEFLNNYFEIGVAGDLVAFVFGEDYLVEQVAPNTYLTLIGRAEASVGRSLSSISTSFHGRIDYCALSAPMKPPYSCGSSVAVAHAACESENHQLIVTRR